MTWYNEFKELRKSIHTTYNMQCYKCKKSFITKEYTNACDVCIEKMGDETYGIY